MPTRAIARNTDLVPAVISFNSTGDNTVIAAIANQQIRVYKMFLVFSAATNLIIKNGSTALTGTLTMSAGGAIALDASDDPWFITSVGNALVINQSGTATIGGLVWYAQP